MPSIAGYKGRVTCHGQNAAATEVTLPSTRWQVNWHTDAIEDTTFRNIADQNATPQSSWIAGITDADCSFDCYWNSTFDPFDADPPNLIPGLHVYLNLYLNFSDNVGWFGECLITDVAMDCEVRGIVKYTVSGKFSRNDAFYSQVGDTGRFEHPQD